MRSAYPDEFILGKLTGFIRELGHFPTFAALRVKAYQSKRFPSHNTFRKFGKKQGLTQAALDYCGK